MSRKVCILLGLLFLLKAQAWAADYRPEKPFPGAPVLFSFREKVKKLTFLGRTFYPFAFQGRYCVLAAIPLGTSPGRYPVAVFFTGGKKELSLEVFPKKYPEEHLKVPKKMVRYPPKVLSRIKREIRLIRSTVSRISPEPLLDGPFVWPAAGRLSSPFGLRRFFNGEPRSPHAGLDIALPEGTLVKAANRGRVVLVGDFYLPGKIVIIDHGLGIYTVYCHLKKILVKKGELVARGQKIARSGKTGRVTGPHLHFGVYIGGVKVDPKVLLEVF